MISFQIDNWCLWDLENTIPIEHPNLLRGRANPDKLPAMVKRRMPPLAKAMFMAEQQLADNPMPTIYASKHAELSRTIGLIKQFGEDLSPMSFSMSVNNSLPGLLSVINKNTQPYTVIDSLSGVIEYALLEAYTQLAEHSKLRVVYFEEQTTDVMNHSFQLNDHAMVLAMDISQGQQWQLNMGHTDVKTAETTDMASYAGLLTGQKDVLEVSYRQQKWLWQRH